MSKTFRRFLTLTKKLGKEADEIVDNAHGNYDRMLNGREPLDDQYYAQYYEDVRDYEDDGDDEDAETDQPRKRHRV
jgi:hypothetical protein